MANVPTLCDLLCDAVDSGASIGFMPPMNSLGALAYWYSVREAIDSESRLLFAAFDDEGAVGTVQLELAMRANAVHRAEVMKLMVHRRARRSGVGTSLMLAMEKEARLLERPLLVLDTRKGDPSEALYIKLGYNVVGEIPYYARSADRELHTTVFFYKLLF